MSKNKIGSYVLVGTLFGLGGITFFSFGPKIGPIHFNSGIKGYTDYDVQKARLDRIVAEKKAEEAAHKRAEAEEQAESAARWRATREKMGIEKETGEVFSSQKYTFLCAAKERTRSADKIEPLGSLPIMLDMYADCEKRQMETVCPGTGEKGGWKIFHTDGVQAAKKAPDVYTFNLRILFVC
jgi:hypothetical protein